MLGAAANPLLRQLGYLRSKSPEACLTFYLTAGALSLPREELRALVAHSLGHLHLDHERTTGRRVSTRVGGGLALEGVQARGQRGRPLGGVDRAAPRYLLVGSDTP
ncbi:MAG TPA: hypothetical protein VGM22_04615 [Methylomirabilota bacterium]